MSVELAPDETLDDLRLGGLQIIQRRDGYRFSLDPVLLCDFIRPCRPGCRLVDLGTGSGVIPLILARAQKARRLLGLELQVEMAERARRSVKLNGLDDRIEILQADIRNLPPSLTAQSFDVVVSNPPFRASASGRVAPDRERAVARHELSGGLDEFLSAAAVLLRSGGVFYMVYLAERLAELLAGMREVGLEPKRLRLVHSRQGDSARLVLVEGSRGGRAGVVVEPPLFIYRGVGRDYSSEVLEIYNLEEE